MQRLMLIVLGWFAVALAVLGALLPLLPTTPFLLLAAACFARSSPRFHSWLLYRSWFGGYLRCWQQHRAMPEGAKWRALIVLIITFAVSVWWVKWLWLRGILLIILAALLFFLWRVPVVKSSR